MKVRKKASDNYCFLLCKKYLKQKHAWDLGICLEVSGREWEELQKHIFLPH